MAAASADDDDDDDDDEDEDKDDVAAAAASVAPAPARAAAAAQTTDKAQNGNRIVTDRKVGRQSAAGMICKERTRCNDARFRVLQLVRFISQLAATRMYSSREGMGDDS
jgi:hypothetical protein